MEVSDALRRFRRSTGLNQDALAERLGIKRQAYQPYETGKVTPSVGTIIKIAQEFDVSADYLLGLSDEPRPTPPKADDEELINALVTYHRAINTALKNRGIEL